MDGLSLALLLAAFNKAVLDLLAQPLQKRWPNVDLWWMIYVALVTGGAAAWFAGANIFAGLVEPVLIGRILTCVAVGAGTNLINQLFTALPAPVPGGRASLFRGAVDEQPEQGRLYRGW